MSCPLVLPSQGHPSSVCLLDRDVEFRSGGLDVLHIAERHRRRSGKSLWSIWCQGCGRCIATTANSRSFHVSRTIRRMGTVRVVAAPRQLPPTTPASASDSTVELADTDVVLSIAAGEADRWTGLLTRLAR